MVDNPPRRPGRARARSPVQPAFRRQTRARARQAGASPLRAGIPYSGRPDGSLLPTNQQPAGVSQARTRAQSARTQATRRQPRRGQAATPPPPPPPPLAQSEDDSTESESAQGSPAVSNASQAQAGSEPQQDQSPAGQEQQPTPEAESPAPSAPQTASATTSSSDGSKRQRSSSNEAANEPPLSKRARRQSGMTLTSPISVDSDHSAQLVSPDTAKSEPRSTPNPSWIGANERSSSQSFEFQIHDDEDADQTNNQPREPPRTPPGQIIGQSRQPLEEIFVVVPSSDASTVIEGPQGPHDEAGFIIYEDEPTHDSDAENQPPTPRIQRPPQRTLNPDLEIDPRTRRRSNRLDFDIFEDDESQPRVPANPNQPRIPLGEIQLQPRRQTTPGPALVGLEFGNRENQPPPGSNQPRGPPGAFPPRRRRTLGEISPQTRRSVGSNQPRGGGSSDTDSEGFPDDENQSVEESSSEPPTFLDPLPRSVTDANYHQRSPLSNASGGRSRVPLGEIQLQPGGRGGPQHIVSPSNYEIPGERVSNSPEFEIYEDDQDDDQDDGISLPELRNSDSPGKENIVPDSSPLSSTSVPDSDQENAGPVSLSPNQVVQYVISDSTGESSLTTIAEVTEPSSSPRGVRHHSDRPHKASKAQPNSQDASGSPGGESEASIDKENSAAQDTPSTEIKEPVSQHGSEGEGKDRDDVGTENDDDPSSDVSESPEPDDSPTEEEDEHPQVLSVNFVRVPDTPVDVGMPTWGWTYDLYGANNYGRGTHPKWRRERHHYGRGCLQVHGCFPGSNCQGPKGAFGCSVCHNIWLSRWDEYFQAQAALPRQVDNPKPGPGVPDPREDYLGFLAEDFNQTCPDFDALRQPRGQDPATPPAEDEIQCWDRVASAVGQESFPGIPPEILTPTVLKQLMYERVMLVSGRQDDDHDGDCGQGWPIPQTETLDPYEDDVRPLDEEQDNVPPVDELEDEGICLEDSP